MVCLCGDGILVYTGYRTTRVPYFYDSMFGNNEILLLLVNLVFSDIGILDNARNLHQYMGYLILSLP